MNVLAFRVQDKTIQHDRKCISFLWIEASNTHKFNPLQIPKSRSMVTLVDNKSAWPQCSLVQKVFRVMQEYLASITGPSELCKVATSCMVSC